MAQDPFTIMRAAFTLQRLLVLQGGSKSEQNLPPLLTCRDVLEFATVEGARCANLERKVGTLAPGKEADIVMRSLPSGRAKRGPGGADRAAVWPSPTFPFQPRSLPSGRAQRGPGGTRRGGETDQPPPRRS